jgi:hypothetical protein
MGAVAVAAASREPGAVPAASRAILGVHARREGPVTSNVSQNYPYTSESEAERAGRIAALLEAKDDLAGKLAAETTPLDANERWWVWKCPTKGCPGLLHVAGYAIDKHAVYVVCDGTCGKTFLR